MPSAPHPHVASERGRSGSCYRLQTRILYCVSDSSAELTGCWCEVAIFAIASPLWQRSTRPCGSNLHDPALARPASTREYITHVSSETEPLHGVSFCSVLRSFQPSTRSCPISPRARLVIFTSMPTVEMRQVARALTDKEQHVAPLLPLLQKHTMETLLSAEPMPAQGCVLLVSKSSLLLARHVRSSWVLGVLQHHMAWCRFVTRCHDIQVTYPWQSLVTPHHSVCNYLSIFLHFRLERALQNMQYRSCGNLADHLKLVLSHSIKLGHTIDHPGLSPPAPNSWPL